MPSIVLVHGTGVRPPAFERTVERVRGKLRAHLPGWTLVPCSWGEPHGARLRADGASVPGYATTRGPGGASAEDEEIVLWRTLYDDPRFEMRLLATRGARHGPPALRRPDEAPPGEALREAVAQLRAAAGLAEPLERSGLAPVWEAAVSDVARSQELRELAAAADPPGGEHRTIVARALVATAVLLAEEEGIPPPDGDARDELVRRVTALLGGDERAAFAWLRAPFVAMAVRYGTWRGRRRRRTLTDVTHAPGGDVVLYQARGEPIRNCIRETVQAAPRPVVLLAHSLGGIACVDLLATEPLDGVEALVTVGSQAPFLYEIGALWSREYGSGLPAHFPRWLNAYDPNDFLSFLAEPVFPGRAADFEVRSRQPFPRSHGAYWSSEALWRRIAEWVA